jgi:tetratricopeptide (TPR) repeat protein
LSQNLRKAKRGGNQKMGLFSKLFAKKKTAEAVPAPESSLDSNSADNKNLIKVYDAYGRELLITRQEWRDKVLLGNLKLTWDQPDKLYTHIVFALQDGFRADVIDAARHLYEIDPDRVRSTCVWAIVLFEENRLDEAEETLKRGLSQVGEDGTLLTNLAKVYSRRKDDAKAEDILWHSLEVDPNQENGLAWYEAIYREREGADGNRKALSRVAALPGSWRAQTWQARNALESNDLPRAIDLYRQSLRNCSKPISADLLMGMSGELGKHGHLRELLDLTEPHFDVHIHGMNVGNNLIKSHLELGELDAAERLIAQHYALNRPDWKNGLNYFETEIAKARLAATTAQPSAPLKCAMIDTLQPIWLPRSSLANQLFLQKSQDSSLVCFLGSSVEQVNDEAQPQRRLPDATGRMSRALPLFLAEQVYFGTEARVSILHGHLTGPQSGFAVFSRAWTLEEACNHASKATPPGDYVVVTHLLAHSDPWQVQLRLIRVAGQELVEELTATIPSKLSDILLLELANRVQKLLKTMSDIRTVPFPDRYKIPSGTDFASYLLRLEQLLAIRACAVEGVNSNYLTNMREVLDGNLSLCVDSPTNVTVRVILAQTLWAMRKIRPELVKEFDSKVKLLQKEKPLDEEAQRIVQRIFDAALESV